MRRFITTLLASGLANIASAHTLDSEHRLAESLWHQVMGSHHLPSLRPASAAKRAKKKG